MLFTQIEFIIFFIILLAFLSIVKNNAVRKVFLLAASYYFYAYWDYRFLGLIIISTLVDYCIGRCLDITIAQYKRRYLMVLSLAINLGILGFFKYYNFFISSLQYLIEPTGLNLTTLDIILPVGISFYTFQKLSYIIDLYRNKIECEKSLLDFALFVGFFPQLVAGPIVRASFFLPQLKTHSTLSRENFAIGFRFFVIGLFMKVFIADRLAMFVDPFFANAGVFDYSTTWLAVSAYSLQIYCDFAGYSNMAIGLARIMGYDLNVNFNFPYLSKSISEFWKRWHISLSSWIRDYLYIPLGGNRKGLIRTYINLMIAMLLIGLWHGAAWTFVLWGGVHGAALVINRVWTNTRHTKNRTGPDPLILTLAKWGLTMLVVMTGWVLFRSKDFHQAFLIFEQMYLLKSGLIWHYPFAIFVLAGAGLIHLFKALNLTDFINLPVKAWYTPAVLFSMIGLVLVFYPKGFHPFIYFQF